MDYYTCQRCGVHFDEFEMDYAAAQTDKQVLCSVCRNLGDDPQNIPLREMGFWEADGSKLEMEEEVRRFIGPAVQGIELILRYMNAARRGKCYLGWACCRLCGEDLGSADMVTPDGLWTFPENWQHYITVHNVRPTEPAFSMDGILWAISREDLDAATRRDILKHSFKDPDS